MISAIMEGRRYSESGHAMIGSTSFGPGSVATIPNPEGGFVVPKGNPGWPAVRFDVLRRDGFTCRYCGKKPSEAELEVDHIHPRSIGGPDGVDNLVTACRDCNRGKRDRTGILPPPLPIQTTLVGNYFHTFKVFPEEDNRRHINEQGVIVADLGGGHYLIQLFEWVVGGKSFYGRKVVHISDIRKQGWSLYETAEAMQEAFKYGGAALRLRDHPD